MSILLQEGDNSKNLQIIFLLWNNIKWKKKFYLHIHLQWLSSKGGVEQMKPSLCWYSDWTAEKRRNSPNNPSLK